MHTAEDYTSERQSNLAHLPEMFHTSLGTLIDSINQYSSPVKIIFNDLVLYNDYDSNVEIEDGVYGEIAPPYIAVPERIKKFKNSVVTSVSVRTVHHHHSIVTITGDYREEEQHDVKETK